MNFYNVWETIRYDIPTLRGKEDAKVSAQIRTWRLLAKRVFEEGRRQGKIEAQNEMPEMPEFLSDLFSNGGKGYKA